MDLARTPNGHNQPPHHEAPSGSSAPFVEQLPVAWVHDVSHSYRRGQPVFSHVTMLLQRNGVHALVGKNGAGKTTLMKILSGQLRPTEGYACLTGETIFNNARAMDHVAYTGISVEYPGKWQVKRVLATAARRYPNWDDDYATLLSNAFGLDSASKVDQLSLGQRSILGIVVGLAARAPLTLLDEPYIGLDVDNRALFYDSLLADVTAHPRTVVISTHHIRDAGKLIDRLIILGEDGAVTDLGAEQAETRILALTGRADDIRRVREIAEDARLRVTPSTSMPGRERVLVDTVPASGNADGAFGGRGEDFEAGVDLEQLLHTAKIPVGSLGVRIEPVDIEETVRALGGPQPRGDGESSGSGAVSGSGMGGASASGGADAQRGEVKR